MTNRNLFSISYLTIASYFISTSSSISIFIVYFIRNQNLLDFPAGADMNVPSKPCKTGIGQSEYRNCGQNFQKCWCAGSIYPVICCQAKVYTYLQVNKTFFLLCPKCLHTVEQLLHPTPNLAFQQVSVQCFKAILCSSTVWSFRIESAIWDYQPGLTSMVAIQVIFFHHSCSHSLSLQTSRSALYLEIKERNIINSNWQSQFLFSRLASS